MKSFDEIERSVRQKAELRLAERRRRRKVVLRSCAIGVGAAAVLGVGLTTFALRPPERPTAENSGLISETETAATTAATTAAVQTAPSTAAPQTTTVAPQTTTTAVTTTQAVTTAQTVTTTTAARTYVTAAATTAPPQTMPPASTQTTASAEVPATTAATTTAAPEVEIWKRVYYGDNKMYRMCSVDNEELTVAESSVGEYYDDAVLAVDIIDIASNRTKRVETPCRIYAYKDLSPEYICIIKETEDSEPKLYSAGASCEALEKSPLVLEYEEAQ